MRTVWKYQVMFLDETDKTFQIPPDATIVHVALERPGVLAFWAEVTASKSFEDRHFVVIGTGHPVPDGSVYRGTVQDGWLVLHLYERT